MTWVIGWVGWRDSAVLRGVAGALCLAEARKRGCWTG